MATYVNNLRLKEIVTGAESGTWGTSTNTNLELIADALGSGTEAITTNADAHTTTIADGTADEGRALFLKYTGTLDSACTITLAPNTVNKVWFIENATSGSQNIIISQGSGANITIANGKIAVILTDGAGSGAAVLDALADLELSSTLSVAGASTLTGVTTHGGNVVSDADSTDDLGTTGVRWANLWVDAITMGGTLGGAVGTFSSTLGVTGLLTATAGITSGSNIVSDTDSTDSLGSTGVRWANLWVDAITMGGTFAGAVGTFSSTLAVTGTSTLTGNVGMGTGAGVGHALEVVEDAADTNMARFKYTATAAPSASNGLNLWNTATGSTTDGGLVFSMSDNGGIERYAGSITVDKVGTWTSTASTRDGQMRFNTAVDGVIAERFRIKQTGVVNFTSAVEMASTLAVTGTSTLTGNVGIGQAAGSRALEVTEVASGTLVAKFINSHASTPYGFIVEFSGDTPDDNTQYFSAYTDATATRAICYSDGDWLNADGTYGTISDLKLKRDITAARSQWNDIKLLSTSAINYRSIHDSGDGRVLLGWGAQDVQAAGMGGLVMECGEGDEAFLGLRSSVIHTKAVIALGEAMLRIEALEEALAAL